MKCELCEHYSLYQMIKQSSTYTYFVNAISELIPCMTCSHFSKQIIIRPKFVLQNPSVIAFAAFLNHRPGALFILIRSIRTAPTTMQPAVIVTDFPTCPIVIYIITKRPKWLS